MNDKPVDAIQGEVLNASEQQANTSDHDPKGRFVKGNQTAKMGVRARSFAERLRKQTKELKAQATAMIAMSIRSPGYEKISYREQQEAIKWLGAYCYGKPVDTTVQIAANATAQTSAVDISGEQLRALALTLRITNQEQPATGVSKGVEATEQDAKPAQAKAG